MKSVLKLTFLGLIFAFVGCSSPQGEKAQVKDADTTTQKTEAAPNFFIDAKTSKVNWTGVKPTGKHTGTIAMKDGNLVVENGQIKGGSFTLDMNSLTVTDLKPGEGKEDLEGHLKGASAENADHFFNVEKYPTGSFEITKVVKVEGQEDANCMITGNLTLKGTTKQVSFRTMVSDEGGILKATTPVFKINRTTWGVNYGSKSVFSDLGDKFINDEVDLVIDITANPG